MKKLLAYSYDYPLKSALLLGLFLRLIATVFAQGYIAHDDHFTIIESSASFADGEDYRSWLPGSIKNTGPEGHSFFYLGLHYFYFSLCNAVDLDNPKIQMLLVRLGHALFSLFTILLGFRITERISNKSDARTVAFILATLAIFPNYSVRNLVEMVCIVPLLWATWLVLRERKNVTTAVTLAGVAAGLSIGIRYQTVVFAGGLAIVILIQKGFLKSLIYGLAVSLVFFLTQISDLFLWGKPFAELIAYIDYNAEHGQDYFSQPWYTYLLVLAGFLVPPVSLFLLFGYFKKWKSQLLLFLPTFLFLLVHSLIGNKQERFILPAMPFIIILGVVGWNEWIRNSSWWKSRKGLHNGIWTFFWIINLAVGIGFALSYGKKARVEAMYALYHQEDYRAHVVDNRVGDGSQLPLFYTGKWMDGLVYNPTNVLKSDIKYIQSFSQDKKPNFLLFYGDEDIESRLESWREYFPSLDKIKTVEPSFLDWVLHKANPRNKYTRVHIYHFSEFETVD